MLWHREFIAPIVLLTRSFLVLWYSALWAHSGPENLKKPRPKKLVKSSKSKKNFREIAFLAVLNFFPVQKLNFGDFYKWHKMEFGQKIFIC